MSKTSLHKSIHDYLKSTKLVTTENSAERKQSCIILDLEKSMVCSKESCTKNKCDVKIEL